MSPPLEHDTWRIEQVYRGGKVRRSRPFSEVDLAVPFPGLALADATPEHAQTIVDRWNGALSPCAVYSWRLSTGPNPAPDNNPDLPF